MAEPVETPIGTVTTAHFEPGHLRHQAMIGPKFCYALFNPRDRMHVVARAFMRFLRDDELPYRRLVLNDHILDEAATRLKKRATMKHAVSFLDTLEASTLYEVEQLPGPAFEAAKTRFVEWDDLDASFTDFLVIAHMNNREIDHVLTFDRHFDAFDVITLPYHEPAK